MAGKQVLPAFAASGLVGHAVGRDTVGGAAMRADDHERAGHLLTPAMVCFPNEGAGRGIQAALKFCPDLPTNHFECPIWREK
jgi:hypothetical protein